MAKSIDELLKELKPEKLPTAGQDLADLPEFGTFEPPPQPGPYRFKLPNMNGPIYDLFDVSDKNGQRLKIYFDHDNPLLIVQSPGGKYNQQPFQTRITSNERPRGKKGSGVIASDVDYLLRACGVKVKPDDNAGYLAFLRQQTGKEFGADLRYSWRCSQDRDIRVKDGSGNTQVVEGRKGCGAAFYQEDVDRLPDGSMPYEITCQCGALLRAFANMDNIRA